MLQKTENNTESPWCMAWLVTRDEVSSSQTGIKNVCRESAHFELCKIERDKVILNLTSKGKAEKERQRPVKAGLASTTARVVSCLLMLQKLSDTFPF